MSSVTIAVSPSTAPGSPPPQRAPVVVLDARVVTGRGGGPEKTILNSPRFLEPAGYRMLCAYLHPPDDPGFEHLRRRAAACQAPLVDIPDRGPWDWRVVTRLLETCRREKVTIWHGHDYKSNALGLLLARLHPMRLVTTVHGWVKQTRRTPLYYQIDKCCLPRYERVVCVSTDLYAECLALGVPVDRCVLLENGIDAVDWKRTTSTAEAKRRLGLPPGRRVIGAAGRLSAEKGFDVLIQAAANLHRAGSDVQLLILGEGDDRPRLERLLASSGLGDRGRLLGFQADPRPYYEAFDVFALSSLREGLPNVLLEAMALELPVIATRVNGVPRLVEDGETGILVEAGDADVLTSAVAGLLADAELRARFASAAREAVTTRFSFAARMDRLARIYDAMLNQR